MFEDEDYSSDYYDYEEFFDLYDYYDYYDYREYSSYITEHHGYLDSSSNCYGIEYPARYFDFSTPENPTFNFYVDLSGCEDMKKTREVNCI